MADSIRLSDWVAANEEPNPSYPVDVYQQRGRAVESVKSLAGRVENG